MEKDEKGEMNMAKKKRRKKGNSLIQSVEKFLRIGAFAGPAVYHGVLRKAPNNETRLARVMVRYTGFWFMDGSFQPHRLLEGYGPYVVTSLIQKGIHKLNGLIRRL